MFQTLKPLNFSDSSCLINLNFKWKPASSKTDFTVLENKVKKHNVFLAQPFGQRSNFLFNHFEFHKELTRKDDLLKNLKTQLMHDQNRNFITNS